MQTSGAEHGLPPAIRLVQTFVVEAKRLLQGWAAETARALRVEDAG